MLHERISMRNYKEELKAHKDEIDQLILKTEKTLKKYKGLPNKRIIISQSNGCDQYYLVDKNTQKRNYVKKSEKDILTKIAQRDYELAINKELKKISKSLGKFLDAYDVERIENIYGKMARARKLIVEPCIETAEYYIEKWKAETYDSLTFNDETEYFSNNGIRVRSKSELIIANSLEQKGIPYKYERPLFLDDLGMVRPDFTCLNVKTRKEYIWEHFGMMDNIAYANKNIGKINAYERNGFFPGKNMIVTFESSQNNISSNIIKAMLEQYLL